MKEKYTKPVVASNMNIGGVIPVGFPAAIAAFTGGVAAGVAVKKMLNGRIGWEKVSRLVEVGAAI